MHLEIKQDVNKTETVNPLVIDKLYDLSYEDQLNGIASLLDSTSDVQGRIHTSAADEDKVRYLAGIDPEDAKRFLNLYISVDDGGYYIKFKDAGTKAFCVLAFGGADGGTIPTDWRKNGVKVPGVAGEITHKLAASIMKVYDAVFSNKKTLGSFDEFRFFTGINIDYIRTFSNSSITSIIIPNNVSVIGGYAFSGCVNLSKVVLPDTITSIGTYVFDGCKSLNDINIPANLNSISENAFRGCTSLTSITLPEGLTSIGAGAFSNTGLTTCNIPSTVQSIGREAFSSTRITDIEIPYGVSIIENATFMSSKLERILIPSTVTTIGTFAFRMAKLTNVTIPAAVTSIGHEAFYACPLTEIKVLATTPPTLNVSAFYSVPSSTKIQVPAESVEAYKAASGWNNYASRIIAIQE